MFSLNLKGRLLFVEKPLVMGILNVTPDSFYAGSRASHINEIVQKAGQMISEGADIIDVGGQSTRPGSERIDEKEEMARVLPAVEAIHHNFPDAWISIDSFYANVAAACVQAGASMINDISAGRMDEAMPETAAALRVPFVAMHMPGTPQTMQHLNVYGDVVNDVIGELAERLQFLRNAGINDLIADPGFGFGKNPEQNFDMLNRLNVFRILRVPLLVGLSRKSTIYKTLGITAEESLNGTTVLNTVALLKGASILRVHDVREASEAIRLMHELGKTKKPAI